MRVDILPVDADSLDEAGAVHAAAWQASHRAFCTPEFVARHTPQRQARYLSEKLAKGSRLFMLRLDGKAIGVVTVSRSLIEDLYILPECQNRGFGTMLLRYAVRQCADAPTLWILENNTEAERLYRREGFAPTGRRNAIADKLDEVEFELRRRYSSA